MQHPHESRDKHHLGVRDEGEIGPAPEQRDADGNAVLVRWDRVRKARRAIEQGAYSDPQILDQALERMLRSLGA